MTEQELVHQQIEEMWARTKKIQEEAQAEIEKAEKVQNVIKRILLYALLPILVGLGCIAISLGALGWGIVVIAGALTGMILIIRGMVIEKKDIIQEENREKEEAERKKAEEEKIIASVKSGEYEFPVNEFYSTCAAFGITELRTEYQSQKAQSFLLGMFAALGVPESCCSTYIKNMKQLFYEGKANVTERNKKPYAGTLDKEDEEISRFHNKYAAYSGKWKTQQILTENCSTLKQEIDKKIQGEKAVHELGYLMYSSAATKPKSDWAVLGGLASGIAGPIAGAAVAADAMVRNAQIEAQNQRNREAISKITFQMNSAASASRFQLEDALKLLQHQQEQLKGKLVIPNVPEDKLARSLSYSSNVTKKKQSTAFSITVKNSFVPDLPRGVAAAIDGSLTATVLCDKDTVVGSCDLALPLFGVECRKSVTVNGAIPAYMQGTHTDFRVEVKPKKLWLVEL